MKTKALEPHRLEGFVTKLNDILVFVETAIFRQKKDAREGVLFLAEKRKRRSRFSYLNMARGSYPPLSRSPHADLEVGSDIDSSGAPRQNVKTRS